MLKPKVNFNVIPIYLRTGENIFFKFADKMRSKFEKCIGNIWTQLKWEPSLSNLNWTPSKGLNQ